MAIYLFEMRDFLDERFQRYVDIDLTRTDEFVNEGKIAQQIHLDVLRSLWRYHFFIELSIGKNEESHLQTQRVLQSIFERLVYDIWTSLDSLVSKAYYQSVTDILEIVFGAYINFNQIFRNVVEVTEQAHVSNDTYEYYKGDMQPFFNYEYEKVVQIGVQVLYHLYDQTHFNLSNVLNTCRELYQYIGKYDKKLYKTLQESADQDIIETSFVPFVFSCGLHFAQDLSLSSLLAKALLGYEKRGQMKILQRLISGCAQLCYPKIFKGYFTGQHISYKYEEQEMTEVDGIEVLNHGIAKIIGDSDYAAVIIHYLHIEMKNKYIERYRILGQTDLTVSKLSQGGMTNSTISNLDIANSIMSRK